ncbi:MAG: hypothetical protein HY744_31030 [Deltaproteobacteria bacterium]|nr:hypothetical protein [Deltaproteobacteria bacterium]
MVAVGVVRLVGRCRLGCASGRRRDSPVGVLFGAVSAAEATAARALLVRLGQMLTHLARTP